MLNKFDVIDIGELNADFIVVGLENEPALNREILAKDFQKAIGSSTAICAANLANLGLPPRNAHRTEQIIVKLREVEVLCAQGKTVGESVRQIGVTERTYYRWRKKYGGMSMSDAKKYHELEKENAQLKKLVADLSLDNAILKDVAEGRF